MIKVLITLNILVFLGWYILPAEFMFYNFLVSWLHLVDGKFWTLITSVFSHKEALHLFFNMMVLRSFGPFMIEILGKKRFLAFYFIAGIVASFAHSAVSAFYLHQPELPALGASGSLAGIILLFSLLFPEEKLLILGLIPVRAIWGALLFVGIDLWGLVAQSNGGGFQIGHGAHLGGSLCGLVYYLILRKQFRKTIQ